MVRRLLSFIAVATVSVVASAQVWVSPMGAVPGNNGGNAVTVKNEWRNHIAAERIEKPAKPVASFRQHTAAPRFAPMAPQASDGVWWGYDMGTQGIAGWGFASLDNALGGGGILASQKEYNVAMYLPSSYAGAVIDSLSIYFLDPAKMSDVTIWFAPLTYDSQGYLDLPTNPARCPYSFKLSNDQIEIPEVTSTGYAINPTKIKLPQAYTVPAAGTCIGYAFTGQSDDIPILVSYQNSEEKAFFFSYLYQGIKVWDDFGSFGAGSLTTQAYMDISNVTKDKASVSHIGEFTVKTGEPAVISTKITNEGPNEITSISYVLTVDGVAQEEKDVPFSGSLASMATAGFRTATTVDAGVHDIKLAITKVNGNANAYAGVGITEAEGTIVAIDSPADRTSVVEESTGTWCGWCPRGHVGLEKLNEALGDKVITLAAHVASGTSEPMACKDYDDFHSVFTGGGAPIAIFDRLTMADPYSGWYELKSENDKYRFAADSVVKTIAKDIPSEASVALKAEWADNEGSAINVTTTTNFKIDRTDAPYGIVFAIKADGLTGQTSAWYQANNYMRYAHNYTDTDMEYWLTAANYVRMTYDDVVVAAWNCIKGTDNSVTAPIVKDADQVYNVQLSIAGNKIIQDRNKLTVVAMLVNRNNLRIVNAAAVDMGMVPAGIDGVTTDGGSLSEVARYNANGVRLAAPAKGVNIVKMSDGSTRKVVVE